MLRVRRVFEDLRANQFFLPACAVVVGYVLARNLVGVTSGSWVGESTVESARAVLTTVAAATTTFASIAFSVSLLVMQQGSVQFSPRVLPALTRDPFNRRVIALVMGTFTFTLVTLQRVQVSEGETPNAQVPNVSITIAVGLGIFAVMAVVAAIHHTAQNMNISTILQRIVAESRRTGTIGSGSGLRGSHGSTEDVPEGKGTVISFEHDGWIRSIDLRALCHHLPDGSTLIVDSAPGRYAVRGAEFATLWPPCAEDARARVQRQVASTLDIGATRTVGQDPSLPVRQLVDVSLKALSPGINDPTTALDAIFHTGTVLADRLRADIPFDRFEDERGTVIWLRHPLTDEELAELSLSELRVAAAGLPAVIMYIFEMVEVVVEAARAAGREERAEPFLTEARHLRDQARDAGLSDHDLARVETAYTKRFGSDD
ncbi:MAG: DUF2254 domain-containing protein [Actinobacteria bacterium]|nr:DUF2254 domain-containing protein [Actinomycetota bacterium]